MFTRERFDDRSSSNLLKNQRGEREAKLLWQSFSENSSELSSASNAWWRWRAPLSRTRRPACTLPRAYGDQRPHKRGRTHATEKPGERVERPRAEKVAASRWHVATALFLTLGYSRSASARNLVLLPPPPSTLATLPRRYACAAAVCLQSQLVKEADSAPPRYFKPRNDGPVRLDPRADL